MHALLEQHRGRFRHSLARRIPRRRSGSSTTIGSCFATGSPLVQESGGNLYLAIPLRNVASGLAVLHGWYIWPQRMTDDRRPPVEDFHRLGRDLYVPAGDISF